MNCRSSSHSCDSEGETESLKSCGPRLFSEKFFDSLFTFSFSLPPFTKLHPFKQPEAAQAAPEKTKNGRKTKIFPNGKLHLIRSNQIQISDEKISLG